MSSKEVSDAGASRTHAPKKCQGCSGWEFLSGLCRQHATAKPELAAAIEHYKEKAPLQAGLVVTQNVASPHYIAISEGDKVDILDVLSDNQSVIVRRADGGIGWVPTRVSDAQLLQPELPRHRGRSNCNRSLLRHVGICAV